jgi:hypothetical protein
LEKAGDRANSKRERTPKTSTRLIREKMPLA